MRATKVFGVMVICGATTTAWAALAGGYGADSGQERVSGDLDRGPATILRSAGFTGRIEGTLEARLPFTAFDFGVFEDSSCEKRRSI